MTTIDDYRPSHGAPCVVVRGDGAGGWRAEAEGLTHAGVLRVLRLALIDAVWRRPGGGDTEITPQFAAAFPRLTELLRRNGGDT